MSTFEFRRYRFHFGALDDVHFPRGKSSNTLRGAFGIFLRESSPPDVYARLFLPGAAVRSSPSGLSDWPRPFLFRAAHLDGVTVPSNGRFHFDLHVFDLREPVLEPVRRALLRWSESGLGPRRGRAELERVTSIGLDDEDREEACRIDMTPPVDPVNRIRLRFLTPTELKSGGAIAERPEFPILFGRLRDRLSTLRALYGPGPLDIDFRGLGDRAAAVRLERSDLVWRQLVRKSTRTGQIHPLGGFTGTADYAGELAEFLPWLRAARWIGVGRHTVWGNGDLRVEETRSASDAGA